MEQKLYDKVINEKLDFSKPIVPQLATLTKQEYEMLMRVPYIFKSGKEVKLYDNQILEWAFKNDIRTSQMVLIPLSFVYFCISIRQLLLEE